MVRRRKAVLALAGAAAVIGGLVVPGAASAAPGHVVVVSGLNNPRQLSLLHGTELLVAEAGRGGSLATIPGGEGATHVGRTGSITSVSYPQYAHGVKPNRIITGLPSGASGPHGSFAVGPDGVSARNAGHLYVQQTYFARISALGRDNRRSGRLLRSTPYGTPRPVANITAYERRHDPDGQGFNSNPYAVLGGRHNTLVADAAGNDVLKVVHGRVRLFHVFRNITTGPCEGQTDENGVPGCEFVPTSLARDKHGNVYVGGLSSLVPGAARVVEFSPGCRHRLHTWKGFTSVTGVAVDRHGNVYVSQLFANKLTKITPGGTRTDMDVPYPAGVITDWQGNVYVSAYSVASASGLGQPGTSGQVWRMRF